MAPQPAQDSDITTLLLRWSAGDPNAYQLLIPLVYENLRHLAGGLSAHAAPLTQPTAIVHELYLKLVHSSAHSYQNRVHFFSAAARAMRQILIDRSRRDLASKRGGQLTRAPFSEDLPLAALPSAQLLDLDDALTTLASHDEALASLLELRHFGGMTLDEIAALRQTSPETVRRQLRLAEAWLASLLRRP